MEGGGEAPGAPEVPGVRAGGEGVGGWGEGVARAAGGTPRGERRSKRPQVGRCCSAGDTWEGEGRGGGRGRSMGGEGGGGGGGQCVCGEKGWDGGGESCIERAFTADLPTTPPAHLERGCAVLHQPQIPASTQHHAVTQARLHQGT